MIKKQLKNIGVSKEGIEIMWPKFEFKKIRLFDIDSRAANILKQEMLSIGGEVAISREVVKFSTEKTDALIGGTIKQYLLLIDKLKNQPFELNKIADKINEKISFKIDKPLIMGILNVTPDSFFDGGKYNDIDKAIAHAEEMIRNGAEIIDVGGESSRPGAEEITEEEELNRVIPVIEKLKDKVILSIDTKKSQVAEECLKKGVKIVNDISGLNDDMIKVCAKYNADVIIMHMKGNPNNMQNNPEYNDVVEEIISFLKNRAEKAKQAGIKNITLDPGIGFGKTTQHNLEILNRMDEFKDLGYPVLIGTSRKSFIGKILNEEVNERLEGTIATIILAYMKGCRIFRVHDVKECKKALKIAEKILNA